MDHADEPDRANQDYCNDNSDARKKRSLKSCGC